MTRTTIFLYLPAGSYIKYEDVSDVVRQSDEILFTDKKGKQIISVLAYTIERIDDAPTS